MDNPIRWLLDVIDESLGNIGRARDGILVLGGVLYILGYTAWSLNAYSRNLGWLPALEAQYFVAGIVPFFICVFIYVLLRVPWEPRLTLPGLNIIRNQQWVRNLLLAMVIVLIVLRTGMLEKFPVFHDFFAAINTWISQNDWIFYAVMGLVFLLLLPAVKAEKLRLDPHRIKVTLPSFIVALFILSLGILAFVYYIDQLYSKLPQSLGGVQPRCAYLDVQKTGLSRETLNALLSFTSVPSSTNVTSTALSNPEVIPATNDDIVRSSKVDLMFSGSDYVLIKVGDKVYEIRKDVIHAVEPCMQDH